MVETLALRPTTDKGDLKKFLCGKENHTLNDISVRKMGKKSLPATYHIENSRLNVKKANY